jgi:hypothetical protein
MLTQYKRDFDPSKHHDLAEGIKEMKEIDDYLEVDGVLYSDEDHYTYF